MNKLSKYICKLLTVGILIMALRIYGQDQDRMYGITIDDISGINATVTALANHSKKMTARIVFDEWVPASDYAAAVRKIDSVSYTMGEILDSYYMNDYSVKQFKDRVDEYQVALSDKIDIWEVGNEINGEWLGPSDSVMAKVKYGLIRSRKNGLKTAVTLYYNHDCWERPENEMFRWINENFDFKFRRLPDYVFVSYYEDDCNNYQPNWQMVFDSLSVLFPNSKLGIGECGTTNVLKKAEFITRYYTMNITSRRYIGGYFWWYYKKDCVPWLTKPLWQVLNNTLLNVDVIKDGDGY
ncbi:MAG: hypothetical protein IAE90_08165 [Ignavibacteria bacterium]|nr:hypothetical protein [Ignavibacteria bacterium]